MLAARWKHDPPGPVPFRADPEHTSRPRRRSLRAGRRPSGAGHRSSWRSTVVVLGTIALVIILLGYLDFRPY